MESADVYILSQVDWQFWITLSFKSDALQSEKLRQSLWFALLRDLAGWWRKDFRNLLWVRRAETGEISARLHWHAVLGGLPDEASSRPTCFAIKNDWERLGGGMARVYVYDKRRTALAYMLDLPGVSSCGPQSTGVMSDGAQDYESRKFGQAGLVTFSEGLTRLLRRRRGIDRKVKSQPRLRVCPKFGTQENQVVAESHVTESTARKASNSALSIETCGSSPWKTDGRGIWTREG